MIENKQHLFQDMAAGLTTEKLCNTAEVLQELRAGLVSQGPEGIEEWDKLTAKEFLFLISAFLQVIEKGSGADPGEIQNGAAGEGANKS